MGAWVNVGSWLRIYQARAGTFANEICVSAHGGYLSIYGYAEIPNSAKVYLYELHGSTQLDSRARDIMSGMTPEQCGITGTMQGGKLFDYHLSKFEGDPEHVPADVDSAVRVVNTEARLTAMGIPPATTPTIARDVVSIRNRKSFGAKWMFGVPLSYVFEEVSGTHAYQGYHLCFCRYVPGGWKYNESKRRYIGSHG
jgi:hypothetical protein